MKERTGLAAEDDKLSLQSKLRLEGEYLITIESVTSENDEESI